MGQGGDAYPFTAKYPPSRVEPVEECLAGVRFEDPFRWLEQESEEVKQWQGAQAELTKSYVRRFPSYGRLRELVDQFLEEETAALPKWAAGRWFRVERDSPQSNHSRSSGSRIIVASQPFGNGQVLFDTIAGAQGRHSTISWISPSPDGCILALGICFDGSERNFIRLLKVSDAEVLPAPLDPLMDSWAGGVQWLADSSGFFFTALAEPAIEFRQTVFLHRLAPEPVTTQPAIQWTTENSYRVVMPSNDGRHAIALEKITNTLPVAVARSDSQFSRWRPFITSVPGMVAGHIVGSRFIGVTDVGAERGRLVAISLDAEQPNDPATWTELVGESNAVLRTVRPVGDMLYISELLDTYARVRIVNHHGALIGEVPLPGRGALGEHELAMANLVAGGHGDRYLFGFSSPTVSMGIFSHSPGESEIEVLRPPRHQLHELTTLDVTSRSADGTPLPYRLLKRDDVCDGPQPTLIYAYGGFNVAQVPRFSGPMVAFALAGGQLVQAHLRGGGELGRSWWYAGRLRLAQNSYDDLYAIAEHLIASKRCTNRLLAVTGRSHGGLLAGVALTQRPDLWRTVVPRVPSLDQIGSCRNAYGRLAVSAERADISDPDEVRRLATFSPYQLVKAGLQYPSLLIQAGDVDPRTPPWHGRKFVAKLQQVIPEGTPALLHVWPNAGHGSATSRTIAVEMNTEWLAFVMMQLGIERLTV